MSIEAAYQRPQRATRAPTGAIALLARGLALTMLVALGGCGYNTLQQRDEAVKAAWSQIISLYQKRADLVPNLVVVVQGYAKQEREIFAEVARARASAGQVQVDADSLEQLVGKQQQLTSALSRLIATAENYPELKSDKVFLDLSQQLVRIENQLAAARNRYIREVRNYNIVVRSFPTNLTAMLFGFRAKEQFQESSPNIRQVPDVSFDAEKKAK
jgi:LemA protein